MDKIKEKAISALEAISQPDLQVTISREVADFLEVDFWNDESILEERRVVDGQEQ